MPKIQPPESPSSPESTSEQISPHRRNYTEKMKIAKGKHKKTYPTRGQVIFVRQKDNIDDENAWKCVKIVKRATKEITKIQRFWSI